MCKVIIACVALIISVATLIVEIILFSHSKRDYEEMMKNQK